MLTIKRIERSYEYVFRIYYTRGGETTGEGWDEGGGN